MTRSPTSTPPTPGPTAATTPATSLPGTKGVGGLIWYRPWQMSPSTKFTPAAFTSTTTCPSPGTGSARSSSTSVSSGPSSGQTRARTDVNLSSPDHEGSSGAQRPQSLHHGAEGRPEGLDVAIGGGPTHRQAEGAFGVDTHGLEHR